MGRERRSRTRPGTGPRFRHDCSGRTLGEEWFTQKFLDGWNDLSEADFAESRMPGVNLSGRNLSKAALGGAGLAGGYLAGAVFDGAGLERADLRHTGCRGASFRKADMRGASLASADLAGADFTDADLTGADLRGARLEGAVFKGANTEDAMLDDGIGRTHPDLRRAAPGEYEDPHMKKAYEDLRKLEDACRDLDGLADGEKERLEKGLEELSGRLYANKRYEPGPDDVIILDSNIILNVIGYNPDYTIKNLDRFIDRHRGRILVTGAVLGEVRDLLMHGDDTEMTTKFSSLIADLPVPPDDGPDISEELGEIRERMKYGRHNGPFGLLWMYKKRSALDDILPDRITDSTRDQRDRALDRLFNKAQKDAEILATAMATDNAVLLSADIEMRLFASAHPGDDRAGKIPRTVRVVSPLKLANPG